MKRTEQIIFQAFCVKPPVQNVNVNPVDSVTNPLHAQTVREKLTNPLPLNPRPINYFQGPPVEKMQSFDRMYADKLEAFKSARECSEKGKQKLNELQKKYEEEQKTGQ